MTTRLPVASGAAASSRGVGSDVVQHGGERRSDGNAIYVSNTDSPRTTCASRDPAPWSTTDGDKPAPASPPTVQGNLAQARITVLRRAASVTPRHLNKHIDYDDPRPAPAGDQGRQPGHAAPRWSVSPDGATLYVAAFGSSKIGVFDVRLEPRARGTAAAFTPRRKARTTSRSLSGRRPVGPRAPRALAST